jgi:membrane-associated phospholipid phosphatase
MRRAGQSETSVVPDLMVTAVGTAVVASVVGGRTLVYGVQLVPERWRRTTEWLVVGSAAAFAISCGLWPPRDSGERVFAFVIAALPGLLTYLACRSAAASALVTILPLYYAIADAVRDRALHAPAIGLDRAVSLRPEWIAVYGSHYVFVLLPLFVARDERLFRRVMTVYLIVFIVGYLGFLAYPTVAPRPMAVAGDGFAAWCLRLNYSLDTPFNCFPSLHVAVSVVAALACHRVHRGVGTAACVWALLIGVSTLYTKQHYAVDVMAGALIGYVAYLVLLRSYPREDVPEADRRLAPRRALGAVVAFGVLIGSLWVLYATKIRAEGQCGTCGYAIRRVPESRIDENHAE